MNTLLRSLIACALASFLFPTTTTAGPITGCVFAAATKVNTCTLVEDPTESLASETVTLINALTGLQDNGFVPIFEALDGRPGSTFQGTISDYLIITNNGANISLVSDGATLGNLLTGLTARSPTDANGNGITVTEPSDLVFNQSVDFYLTSPAGFRDHFIVFSDTTPEPTSLLLIVTGLVPIGMRVMRKRRSRS